MFININDITFTKSHQDYENKYITRALTDFTHTIKYKYNPDDHILYDHK